MYNPSSKNYGFQTIPAGILLNNHRFRKQELQKCLKYRLRYRAFLPHEPKFKNHNRKVQRNNPNIGWNQSRVMTASFWTKQTLSLFTNLSSVPFNNPVALRIPRSVNHHQLKSRGIKNKLRLRLLKSTKLLQVASRRKQGRGFARQNKFERQGPGLGQ